MEAKPAYPYPVSSQPIPNQQPTIVYAPQRTKRDWSVGLCDCFSDCGETICAYCFPPCYLYKIYSAAGEGFCDCLCGGLVPLRVKVRTERGIQGSICNDVMASTFCSLCTMVQVAREIKMSQPLI